VASGHNVGRVEGSKPPDTIRSGSGRIRCLPVSHDVRDVSAKLRMVVAIWNCTDERLGREGTGNQGFVAVLSVGFSSGVRECRVQRIRPGLP